MDERGDTPLIGIKSKKAFCSGASKVPKWLTPTDAVALQWFTLAQTATKLDVAENTARVYSKRIFLRWVWPTKQIWCE